MRLIFSIALQMLFLATWGQAGILNTSFNGGAFITSFGQGTSQAEDMVVQPDGKILVAGQADVGGSFQFAALRFNADGTPDAKFGSGGKMIYPNTGIGKSVALQPDGRIIIGGMTASGPSTFVLIRCLPDGSLDPSFGNGGRVITDVGFSTDNLEDIVVAPNGKIIVAGNIFTGSGYHIGLVQYNSSGTVISSTVFTTGVYENFVNEIKLLSDGKILAAAVFYGSSSVSYAMLVRYLSTGTAVDPSFGINGTVITTVGRTAYGKALDLTADGKIVLAGSTYNPPFATDVFLARYTEDGVIDPSFGEDGVVITDMAGAFDDATGIAVMNDGKIIVGGGRTSYSNPSALYDFAVLRYMENGTPDPSFGSNGVASAPVGTGDDIAYSMAVWGNNIYLSGVSHRTSAGAPSDMSIAAFRHDLFPLPLRFILFTAERKAAGILLTWKTAGEESVDRYTVQRSTNGMAFLPLEDVLPGKPFYTALDLQTISGNIYYRVKAFDKDGSSRYSSVLLVRSEQKGLVVFPNPALRSVQLQLPPGLWGPVKVDLMNAGGGLVHSVQLSLTGSATNLPLDLSSFAKGIYFIRVSHKETVLHTTFMKE
jgi:uncharacterized delta-60 repeat protein